MRAKPLIEFVLIDALGQSDVARVLEEPHAVKPIGIAAVEAVLRGCDQEIVQIVNAKPVGEFFALLLCRALELDLEPSLAIQFHAVRQFDRQQKLILIPIFGVIGPDDFDGDLVDDLGAFAVVADGEAEPAQRLAGQDG